MERSCVELNEKGSLPHTTVADQNGLHIHVPKKNRNMLSKWFTQAGLPYEESLRKRNQMIMGLLREALELSIPDSQYHLPPSALSIRSDEVDGDRNENETILMDQTLLLQRPRHQPRPIPYKRNFSESLAYHPMAFHLPPEWVCPSQKLMNDPLVVRKSPRF